MLQAIKNSFIKNKTLAQYDLRHNDITDDGVEYLIECLKEANHVYELELSEWMNEETLATLQGILKENKPGKKKGGKKKGKK